MNELEKKVPIVGLLVDNRYILACKDWNDNNRPTYYLAQNTHPPKSITTQQLMSNSNHRSKPGKKKPPERLFFG